MDFSKFIMALSELASQLYKKIVTEYGVQMLSDAQAFMMLVNNNLVPLDDSIQQTEKGNYS